MWIKGLPHMLCCECIVRENDVDVFEEHINNFTKISIVMSMNQQAACLCSPESLNTDVSSSGAAAPLKLTPHRSSLSPPPLSALSG